MIKLKIILSSVREGRFGDKPAVWMLAHAKKLEGVDVEILDLKEYPMPFFNDPVSPGMLKTPYTDVVVAKWTQKIAEADAFIIVTPEYNHGYPASLKNAMDWVYKEWNKKPVAYVGYGGVGGARSIAQICEVAMELQLVSIRHTVNITFDYMMKAFADATIDPVELLKPLDPKADALLEQVVGGGNALKKAREA